MLAIWMLSQDFGPVWSVFDYILVDIIYPNNLESGWNNSIIFVN